MYTYHKATENGMTLHIIETDASNIRPVQLLKTSNLKGSNEYKYAANTKDICRPKY